MRQNHAFSGTEPLRPQRILIVRLSAIGDVVHALPALRLLRQAFPQATLGWVVEDFAAAFVEGHPDLDRLHVIPKKRWRGSFLRRLWPEIRPFAQEIRRCRYDVAIDFQGLTKSGLIAWLSGAPRRIGFGGSQGAELNRLFTNEKVIPPPNATHIVERNVALLARLGVVGTPQPPVLPLTEADERAAGRIWADLGLTAGQKAVGLNVGAGWETKRWPVEHWAALAGLVRKGLGLTPVLLWGTREERALAEAVRDRLRAQGEPALIAPPTSLRENAALMRRLTLYYGGDTGATHAAAALGVATVGIYGASDSKRNSPFGPRAVALQAATAPCIPCWKGRCKHSRWLACLKDLTPAMALQAGEKLLESGGEALR